MHKVTGFFEARRKPATKHTKKCFNCSSLYSGCKGAERELPGGMQLMAAAQLTRGPSIPGSRTDYKSVYRLKSHLPAKSPPQTSNDLELQFHAQRELGAPKHPNRVKPSQVAGALLLAGCWVSAQCAVVCPSSLRLSARGDDAPSWVLSPNAVLCRCLSVQLIGRPPPPAAAAIRCATLIDAASLA